MDGHVPQWEVNVRDLQLWLNSFGDERNLLDYVVAFQGGQVLRQGLVTGQIAFEASWETCAFPPGPYALLVAASSFSPGDRRGLARNTSRVDVEVEPCAPGSTIWTEEFAALPGGVDTLRPPTESRHGFTSVLADFAAGIDARCTQENVDCRYGLDFREKQGRGDDSTNGVYRFTVDPGNGTVRLSYRPAGAAAQPEEPLLPDTPSTHVRRGTATNRLAVIAQGDSLRLFVNGEPVGEVRDNRLTWGWISWRADTQATDRGAEAQFDNLVLATPGPTADLRAVLLGP
jgi:hypothetical protein